LLCVLIQLHISFFSQATSTSNIYTLSLHDALPILAYNYYPADELPQTADDYKIAKYAYGKDYHFVIKDKLKTFLEALKEEVGDVGGRAFVDSAPVMERQWAQKAGLGWTGKNSLLLNRTAGSFFFLAELIIDLEDRKS